MSKIRLLGVALLTVLLASAGALAVAAQTPTPPTTGTAPATGAAPVAGAVPTLPSAKGQPSPQFVSMMLGCAESPPVSTAGEGAATFQLSADGNTMNYAIWAFNLNNIDQAHIHMGPAGQPGPIVVWLYPSPSTQSPQTISGRFDGLLMTGSFTSANLVGPLAGQSMSALVQQMQSGNTFANTHTTANPNGEVRGQIVSTSPTAGTPSGTAAAGTAAAGTPPATAVSGAGGTPSSAATTVATLLPGGPGY
ncbi:MAG TPA: CHRD domain-containing protein [Anaerolineae bacterium]|nr:CHRD domain-containing protein [Anaerolineae bacterium]HOR00474.1 CHRD domain-containing protein [Anaerolineae bacterium]HPL29198.1 CHRD domain-containing protein [Anaerolineae bacterium]